MEPIASFSKWENQRCKCYSCIKKYLWKSLHIYHVNKNIKNEQVMVLPDNIMLLMTNNYLAGKYKNVNITIQRHTLYTMLFIAL